MEELFRHYPAAIKQLKKSYRTVKKIGARSISRLKGRKICRLTVRKNIVPCHTTAVRKSFRKFSRITVMMAFGAACSKVLKPLPQR